jgi:hypothetical protein
MDPPFRMIISGTDELGYDRVVNNRVEIARGWAQTREEAFQAANRVMTEANAKRREDIAKGTTND